MKIRFISDLHFGHKNIAKYSGIFRGNSKTVLEADEWLTTQWNSVVKPHDLVWVLGDIAFDRESIKKVKKLRGIKHLILGNHDTYPLKYYQECFNKIHGFMKYKGFWLSHAPIREVRGMVNIHGHTHSNIRHSEPNYYCVCVEAVNGIPISLEEIREEIDE